MVFDFRCGIGKRQGLTLVPSGAMHCVYYTLQCWRVNIDLHLYLAEIKSSQLKPDEELSHSTNE
jgi:hypothetical protein